MKRQIFSLLLIACCLIVHAQSRNKQYESYIKKYRELAVEEMKKYHIVIRNMLSLLKEALIKLII